MTMGNPYLISGPALVSFSGGRTSGYMLAQILAAHGGKLPDDVVVAFADTGLEHAATYAFVDRVEREWAVTIHRVAYDRGNHATPYDALVARKKYLPNPTARFCTQFLKQHPLEAFMKARVGDAYTNVVGIRADEPRRVAKIRARDGGDIETVLPLADAGVTERDVLGWWLDRDFDLGIPPGFGNCTGCFLKSRAQLVAIEQAQPGTLAWWAAKEAEVGGRFRSDRDDYATLADFARRQVAFDFAEPTLDDCACTD